MAFNFDGKVAVVTGASRGIGEATVRQLDAGGARVVLVSRSKKKLNKIATELVNEALVVDCDLSTDRSTDDIRDRVFEKFDRIDILVNNAAIERNEPAHRATAAAIDETLLVNLRQAFMLCAVFAKDLFATQGNVVNVTSTAAAGAGGTQGAYAASKGGLNTLTKNLSNEWANKGVRINAVAPGLVLTEMWEPTFELLGEENVMENFVKRVPLGKWGTPEEIANVICFLASDLASYMTGQVVRVDGGMLNL